MCVFNPWEFEQIKKSDCICEEDEHQQTTTCCSCSCFDANSATYFSYDFVSGAKKPSGAKLIPTQQKGDKSPNPHIP